MTGRKPRPDTISFRVKIGHGRVDFREIQPVDISEVAAIFDAVFRDVPPIIIASRQVPFKHAGLLPATPSSQEFDRRVKTM